VSADLKEQLMKEVSREFALAPRRLMVLVATGTLTLAAACGGGGGNDERSAATSTSASTASDPGAGPIPAPSSSEGPGGAPVQLEVDPCSLLTVPEIEDSIGSGVERGGFGEDLPGHCTYSIGGDVGAGVVVIRIEDPTDCGVLLRALSAGSLDGTNAVRVDVGDGGVFVADADVQFSIGGGCVSLAGSRAGENLGQEALVALAQLAAPRVG
jgi:hypothetical protein